VTPSIPETPRADEALLGILDLLEIAGYDFVTPTPSTHRLIRERSASGDDVLRDIFGWVRPFRPDQIDGALFDLMRTAGLLVEDGASRYRSALRVSCLERRLFLHSAPTRDNDAVFLGPDSYRFARLLRQVLAAGSPVQRALDLGSGAGVGAIVVQDLCPDAEVHASDVNPAALRLVGLNARHAGLDIRTIKADGLPDAPATFELIVANPPYIAGDVGKTYRDGGDDYGAALALDWVRQCVERVTPGGRLILYTGAAVVAGRDVVRDALIALTTKTGLMLDYDEIDPDVFGRTLRQKAYRDVERIAAVGAVLTVPG